MVLVGGFIQGDRANYGRWLDASVGVEAIACVNAEIGSEAFGRWRGVVGSGWSGVGREDVGRRRLYRDGLFSAGLTSDRRRLSGDGTIKGLMVSGRDVYYGYRHIFRFPMSTLIQSNSRARDRDIKRHHIAQARLVLLLFIDNDYLSITFLS